MEIISTSKVYGGRIFIPKEIRDKWRIKDGETLVWGTNKQGQLILTKSESIDDFF